MPFIGNTPDVNFTSFAKQTITGNGGTSYTLSHAVANENEVEIFVNNVRQEGGSGKAYTVNGTALTMTGAVANTDSFYVIFLGKALQTTVPPDGSVSTAKIADSAVSTAKLADNSVTSAKITGVSFGKVLQVVEGRRTTQFAFTSTSYTDVGLTVAITPSSTSSKILLNFFTSNYIQNSYIVTTINRSHSGSTNVNLETSSSQGLVQQHSAGGSQGIPTSLMLLDVPNTTSAVTYTVRMKSPAGVQAYMGINNTPSIIVAQEIGA
jgi:sRNA-binding regulator protein Hfq